jgi:hypothetical protein
VFPLDPSTHAQNHHVLAVGEPFDLAGHRYCFLNNWQLRLLIPGLRCSVTECKLKATRKRLKSNGRTARIASVGFAKIGRIVISAKGQR